MRPRLEVLTVPEKPGYVRVDLPRGTHHLRLPTWAQARRLAEWWTGRPDGDGMWEYSAAVIGASWHHETLELEAAYPLDDPSPANLLRYAEAVQRELEEEGYRAHDIRVLGSAVLDAMKARMAEVNTEIAEAERQADFSAPPPAGTSSP